MSSDVSVAKATAPSQLLQALEPIQQQLREQPALQRNPAAVVATLAKELNSVMNAKCCANPYCFGRCPVARRMKILKTEVSELAGCNGLTCVKRVTACVEKQGQQLRQPVAVDPGVVCCGARGRVTGAALFRLLV